MTQLLALDTCAIIHLMYANCFYLLKQLNYSAITTISVQLEFEQGFLKGHFDSYQFLNNLIKDNEITVFPLDIEDLIFMANVPSSKKASIAELSCFAIAQRLDCQVMTDDGTAVKYIQRYLSISNEKIVNIQEILLKAYLEFLIGDNELRNMQKVLEENDYTIKIDLVTEGARRRLMR